MSLIDELKRRNVFKVTGAYLALGWMIVEMSGTAVPALHLPDWTTSLLLWIGLAGLPIVVAFAWVFELTPEGVKRASEIEPSQSIAQHTGRRLDYVMIAMLGIAMLMFAADRFFPNNGEPTASPEPAVGAGHARDAKLADAASDSRGHGPLPQQESAAMPAPAVAEKSIAVLPFVNMSSDKEQEYFSDGMSEELLNLLAKIPQLKVAARTSSFSFKGKDTAIPEIARQLRVAHVLEGSVRKSGNEVRITAQLIRAEDGYHLWSQTWDRELADVFAVQDEIAGAVVGQLKLTLLGEAPKARAVNPDAFALLLNARQLTRARLPDTFKQSNALYSQALEIDAAYADAWDGLAENYIFQAIDGSLPRDEGRRLAMDALEHALAHDPELVSAHRNLGRLAITMDNDLASAAVHYTRALQNAPRDIDALRDSAQMLMALGRMEAARSVIDHVVRQDPLNPLAHYRRGDINYFAGRFDESASSYRNALRVVPGYAGAQVTIGVVLLATDDTEGALAAMRAESSHEWRRPFEPLILYRGGRTDEAEVALRELMADPRGWDSFVAAAQIARGDADSAFEWLERAVAGRQTALYEIAWEHQLKALHTDPRWLPFLRKIGMAPEQLATISFDVKLPQ